MQGLARYFWLWLIGVGVMGVQIYSAMMSI